MRSHIRAIAVRWIIALAIILAGNALVYAYEWGQRGNPLFYPLWAARVALVVALLVYGLEQS